MPRKGMHTITVYVTKSELDAANKAASASDLSTSRWVRQLISQALGENWPDDLGAHGGKREKSK